MQRYKKDYSKFENLKLWNKEALGDLLTGWAERSGEKTAAIAGEEELSYSELERKSRQMALGFLKMGFCKGDRVIIQLPNSNEYLITLFALFKAGIVPVLVLPAHREAEINAISEITKPKAYILSERFQGFDYIPFARNLVLKHECIEKIIVAGDHVIERENEINLSLIGSGDGELPEVSAYDTAFFLLSGGSTGVPKLIGRTHADYLYLCRLCRERTEFSADDIYMAALPCEHNFPMGNPGILGALDAGGQIVFCKNTSPDEILDLIEYRKVTVTSLVPAMVNMCMDLYEIDGCYDISSLRLLQIGGAVLDNKIAEKIMNTFAGTTLMQVYGTSEGLVITTLLDDNSETIKNYQGKAFDDTLEEGKYGEITQIRIVDDTGKEVQDGQYGELLCKGPYIIDGYYMREDANAVAFTEDGFYRTGDKAMRTAKGYYRISGRIKEQINRAGEKIMPAELEEYLITHESLTDAAVIGVPDPVLGNKIVSFVVSQKGEDFGIEQIHEFLKEKGIARYKLPDECYSLETIPLTAVGKKDTKALLKIAQGGGVKKCFMKK